VIVRRLLGAFVLGVRGCRSEMASQAAAPAPVPNADTPGHPGEATASVRTLEQLIDTKEPGMSLVRSWIDGAKNTVEVLEVERAAGERALVALQVTSRSPMGAIALETVGS
jgi:hypothetical protein